MKYCTKSQITWLAGVIEGEGSFCICKAKSRKTPSADFSVDMTDLDIIERMHKLTGIGNLGKPKIRKKTKYGKKYNKAIYRWRVSKQKDLMDLAQTILPYMGNRRSQKILEVITFLRNKPSIAS